MRINYNNISYNINAHPYKGIYRINEFESRPAYFFDARLLPTKPLRAYIIYRDEDNSVHILTGSNNIEDIQRSIEVIKDPNIDEITKEYFPMLMDYINQNHINVHTNNQYLEDNIALSLVQHETIKRR